MDSFLITSNYRRKNKTVIWKLSTENSFSLSKVADLKITGNELLPNPYDHAAWGITKVNNGYVTAEANGLRLLDENFKTVKRYQDITLFRDLHNVSLINDRLYVANTGQDKIEIFDLEFNHINSINLHDLPYLREKKVFSKKNPTIKMDCFHVNFCSENNGNLYCTLSFITKKSYKLSRRFPFIRRITKQTPGLVYNLEKKNIFIDNLKAAHDGFWFEDKFWVVQSHNMSIDIYDQSGNLLKQKRFKNGAFYRGLSATSKYIIVGITRVDTSRSSSDSYSSIVNKRGGEFEKKAGILVLNRSDFEIIKKIDFPNYEGIFPEVYKIIPND